MKIIFIDETSDSEKKEYLGICCALVDSHSYKAIKEAAQSIFVKSGWNTKVEFKGSTLFSITKGDPQILIDKRIEMARDLIKLNISKKLSRIKFIYCDLDCNNFKKDYLKCLPLVLEKLLPIAPKRAGKDLLVIHFDENQSIRQDELRAAVMKVINKKGYTLLEDVISSHSNFETVGILFADLVGYLVGRRQIISKDSDLFEGFTPEQLCPDAGLAAERHYAVGSPILRAWRGAGGDLSAQEVRLGIS